ncbi:hypothetical protein H1Q78_19230 [Cellulosimicrobium cellulans]|nr:hypothetical protein [Cellulosimicrobium cellulans]UKJ63705.1 hypothetical protein H1Q78_19230 [Cellulosimicrobium cellulans]
MEKDDTTRKADVPAHHEAHGHREEKPVIVDMGKEQTHRHFDELSRIFS